MFLIHVSKVKDTVQQEEGADTNEGIGIQDVQPPTKAVDGGSSGIGIDGEDLDLLPEETMC